MGKGCKVSEAWLQQVDNLGYKYGQWLKDEDGHGQNAFCIVCCASLNIDSTGFQAITRHAKTSKHIKNARSKLEEKQLRLTGCPKEENNNLVPTKTLGLFSVKDAVTKAELLWTFKNIVCDMSVSSCDGISELFYEMFPCETSAKFTLSRTKISYYITEACGPYFQSQMRDDVRKAYGYTIEFDETTNAESKKELQFAVRFYSEEMEAVVTRHLQTYFIGTATAEVILNHIKKVIDDNGLVKTNLLMLSMDGPNVNKKVYSLLNDELKSERNKSLLDLGSCDIHIVHNSFLKGLDKFGIEVEDFIIDLFYFFHQWPQREEDFRKVQEELQLPQSKIIKHVRTRWLSMQDVAERVIQQWSAIRRYFLTFIPGKRKDLLKTKRYKSLTEHLSDKALKAKIYFLIHSATIFQSFTRLFQTDRPLIHILYDELISLVTLLISKVCLEGKTPKAHEITHSPLDEIFNQANLRVLTTIDIGFETKTFMNQANFNEKGRVIFYKGAQQHFIAAAKHLIAKSSLKTGSFLRHCRCLNPTLVQSHGSQSILRIAKKLPLNVNPSMLANEWTILTTIEDFDVLLEEKVPKTDLLFYFWNRIFKMTKQADISFKYPNLTKVVKAALSLSHGNAAVERGFSKSKLILSEDKTAMSLRTLNARLNVASALGRYGNKPHLVPITKELLEMSRLAHNSYQTYLNDKKENAKRKAEEARLEQERLERERQYQKETSAEKKSIETLEAELKLKRKVVMDQSKAGEEVIKEANKRLNEALDRNDLQEVRIAQTMLEGYRKMKAKEKTGMDRLQEMENNLVLKRTKLMEKCVNNVKRFKK